MYAEPNAIAVDTETQALIIQLESSLASDAQLTDLASTVFSRLIGETLAHEIGHALLWDDIRGSAHNSPPIADDIMNAGVDRPFRKRTGMENTAQVSPVLPEHYVDHGAERDRPVPCGQPGADRQAVAGSAGVRVMASRVGRAPAPKSVPEVGDITCRGVRVRTAGECRFEAVPGPYERTTTGVLNVSSTAATGSPSRV